MFERLIVSEPAGAHIRSRRNFFIVSTLAVGSLLLTAVVASIFAEDFGLGTDSFELSVMVMPVDLPATKPEPPRPRTPQNTASSSSQVPTRQVNMSRVDEPTVVPKTTSTAANTQLSRPQDLSRFEITGRDSNPGLPSGTGRDAGLVGDGPGGLATAHQVAETTPDDTPPPPVRTPRTTTVVSGGVVNGQASYLPKPAYPAAALAVRAEGKIDVQVLIDEGGKVVSAKAVSGNALLRDAAERAARNARFTPTLLSKVPVKVTGVIVYNFTHG